MMIDSYMTSDIYTYHCCLLCNYNTNINAYGNLYLFKWEPSFI